MVVMVLVVVIEVMVVLVVVMLWWRWWRHSGWQCCSSVQLSRSENQVSSGCNIQSQGEEKTDVSHQTGRKGENSPFL